MKKVYLTLSIILIFSINISSRKNNEVSIRLDYECEIFEKNFFYKDCKIVRDLNTDYRKMIAMEKGSKKFFSDPLTAYWL